MLPALDGKCMMKALRCFGWPARAHLGPRVRARARRRRPGDKRTHRQAQAQLMVERRRASSERRIRRRRPSRLREATRRRSFVALARVGGDRRPRTMRSRGSGRARAPSAGSRARRRRRGPRRRRRARATLRVTTRARWNCCCWQQRLAAGAVAAGRKRVDPSPRESNRMLHRATRLGLAFRAAPRLWRVARRETRRRRTREALVARARRRRPSGSLARARRPIPRSRCRPRCCLQIWSSLCAKHAAATTA